MATDRQPTGVTDRNGRGVCEGDTLTQSEDPGAHPSNRALSVVVWEDVLGEHRLRHPEHAHTIPLKSNVEHFGFYVLPPDAWRPEAPHAQGRG